jgi:hypothetical protein
MTKIQKNKEPARWLLRKRGEKNIKEADVARFKSELGGNDASMASGSLGPGGRRLRAVNNGGDEGLFGDDDDEEGGRRRRERELGRHGDIDEVDFDDVFEDDEQTMEVDEKEDEESKEIEVFHTPRYTYKPRELTIVSRLAFSASLTLPTRLAKVRSQKTRKTTSSSSFLATANV